ncbi:cytochrome P450 pisatin [Colletotrichum tofieldiae]|uniref:Cytochrome P450 pisatin n=1 Tax=Colletotrichum tofieldiae TaxID=708197 RepID=A0A161YF32_9PEZI|nr:cytochrome P450 pisatin [Colletotrichum tofieldiae]GKT67738.1 cytochrome P450 pisatin [Colletotrichum tofieldiae]
MITLLLLGFVAFVLVTHLTISFVEWFRSPLRSVPGPPLASVTNLWYFQRLKQGSFEKVNLALHEKYGPVVRYGPNRYSINDPEVSKTVYGHGTQFIKSSWYTTWQPSEDVWNLFSDRSITRHSRNRRFYSNAYSMTSLVHYEPYLDECGALFSQRLSEFIKAGAPVDFGHWFQCFAFDAVAMMTYGKRLGFLDSGEDIGKVIQNLDENLVYSSLAGIYPFIHRKVLPLSDKLASILGAAKLTYVLKFTNDRISEMRALPASIIKPKHDANGAPIGESFLSKFLAKHYEEPEQFTNYHLLIGCASNMVAGSDTTGISLSAILYLLLKNPGTLKQLREEIADFSGRGELSEAPTFKQSQQMPYLQAVLKESLRVHPAVALPLERVVPPSGATINGRFFPEGTIVAINCWVHHRNKDIFGEDADQFRPERWLIDDGAKLSVMNRNWIPFGLGSRTCLGKNVSILEMSKLIPRIIRDFDFKLEGDAALPGGAWKTRNAWFLKPRNFHVRVERRKATESS